eukprot:gnl/MRDRNA2_/MRDRNA2_106525_c0_seq1.p1 gnl/MRDRNA2_/MRDRNA2_106525_c0~~gnl/MRDRNA2_/MRDRNA2_106525_c0_seq1.p1  ORF type:complete len:211 (+),score=39.43 gnl/MRDRNA2_/MRDRNA2_106525_c0_seq1:157-789(+)
MIIPALRYACRSFIRQSPILIAVEMCCTGVTIILLTGMFLLMKEIERMNQIAVETTYTASPQRNVFTPDEIAFTSRDVFCKIRAVEDVQKMFKNKLCYQFKYNVNRLGLGKYCEPGIEEGWARLRSHCREEGVAKAASEKVRVEAGFCAIAGAGPLRGEVEFSVCDLARKGGVKVGGGEDGEEDYCKEEFDMVWSLFGEKCRKINEDVVV